MSTIPGRDPDPRDSVPGRGGAIGAVPRAARPDHRRGETYAVVAATLLAVAFARLFPLLLKTRDGPLRSFLTGPLPIAVVLGACLAALTWRRAIAGRGTLGVLSVLAAALLLLGGPRRALSFLLLAGLAALWAVAGRVLSRALLPEESRGWGVSLGLGILLASTVGSYLAAGHVLSRPASLLVVSALVALAAREAPALRRDLVAAANSWSEGFTAGRALLLLTLALLGAFLLVAAAAPETRSDASRFYWPYVKQLRVHEGFFDLPYQWSFVIPQRALAWAGSVIVTAGAAAARWSMTVAWLAMVGILARPLRSGPDARDPLLALTLVVVSCPYLLWLASSTMQDPFVCLATLLAGVLALEGREPGSARFWAGLGALAGLAWTAKFTTLAWVGPLCVCALFRAWRARRARGLLPAAPVAGLAGALSALPWFLHSFQQTGNPVFPFLKGLFPSPLWPHGERFMKASFPLEPSWRGWLDWPWNMTYHTDRFVEGYAGGIGLLLPLALLLLPAGLLWGGWRARALAASAILGTLLLFRGSANVRYALPGFLLLAMASLGGVAGLIRGPAARRLVTGGGIGVVAWQVAFAMAISFFDPLGWPWDFYRGQLTAADYLERPFPGFRALAARPELRDERTRLWFTGLEGAGHFAGQAMDATLWEPLLHGVRTPKDYLRWFGSAGCDYWVVNHACNDEKWLRVMGIGRFFWTESQLVASSPPLALYRMRPLEEALADFDSRGAVGRDLLFDGGLELGRDGEARHWRANGSARWESPSPAARTGTGVLRLEGAGAMQQACPFPPGVLSATLRAYHRSAGPYAAALRLEVTLRDAAGQALGSVAASSEPSADWAAASLAVSVPREAVSADVIVKGAEPDSCGRLLVDDVALVVTARGPRAESGRVPR